jgi:hypothetical protein
MAESVSFIAAIGRLLDSEDDLGFLHRSDDIPRASVPTTNRRSLRSVAAATSVGMTILSSFNSKLET